MVYQGGLPGRDGLDLEWEEGEELVSVRCHFAGQEGHLQALRGQLAWFVLGVGEVTQERNERSRGSGARALGAQAEECAWAVATAGF